MKKEGAPAMKKTVLCIILGLAMIFCFTACGATPDEIPEFIAQDLDGNEVSSSIFSQADITVVNVWGTFCGPCKEEMPELQAWSQELPDNVQIIGILCDVPDSNAKEYADALDIIAKSGVTYPNLLYGGDLEEFITSLHVMPTTFFVDSEGKIIDSITGADVEGYKRAVELLLAK